MPACKPTPATAAAGPRGLLYAVIRSIFRQRDMRYQIFTQLNSLQSLDLFRLPISDAFVSWPPPPRVRRCAATDESECLHRHSLLKRLHAKCVFSGQMLPHKWWWQRDLAQLRDPGGVHLFFRSGYYVQHHWFDELHAGRFVSLIKWWWIIPEHMPELDQWDHRP